jgi:hypothetical protein
VDPTAGDVAGEDAAAGARGAFQGEDSGADRSVVRSDRRRSEAHHRRERRVTATPDTAAQVQSDARAMRANFIGEATSDSAEQYFRLERLEAAGAVPDLEEALRQVREMEQLPFHKSLRTSRSTPRA